MKMEKSMPRVTHGTQTRYACKWIGSPVGRLRLVATDEGLAGILWDNDRPRPFPSQDLGEDEDHPVLVEAERQLAEYFAGQREQFTLTLAPTGTPFQRKV